jgi:hypothetical protein
MELIYTNEEHTTIQATLDEGEQLGNYIGPIVIFVPTDPANKEFGSILEDRREVNEYVRPAAPEQN